MSRWVHEYTPEISKRLSPHLKQTCDSWRLDETYVKVKGRWYYLYRCVDKTGETLDWMLSRNRNKQAAKRFFVKVVNRPHVQSPRVINVDKNPAFPPAHQELQDEHVLRKDTKLRQIKYLNNIIENDHKSVKRKSRYRQWYQSYLTAKKTIDGIESMRMVQKGQLKKIVKGDVCAQNKLIEAVFGLAG